MTAEPHTISSPPVSPPAAKRAKTEPDAAATGSTSTTVASAMNISSIMDAPAAAADPAPAPAAPEATANGGAASRVTPVTLPPLLSEQPASVATAAPPLQVKKLSATARLPTRGSAFAAGYDLYAAKETVIPARGKALVDTDISIAVPAGTYGRIAPRSGLAAKHFIDTGAGVIDADYRGPVKVLLFNHGEADFPVAEGDRIAQLVLERIVTPDVVEVAELEESVRGAGGFGSTGGFGGAASTTLPSVTLP